MRTKMITLAAAAVLATGMTATAAMAQHSHGVPGGHPAFNGKAGMNGARPNFTAQARPNFSAQARPNFAAGPRGNFAFNGHRPGPRGHYYGGGWGGGVYGGLYAYEPSCGPYPYNYPYGYPYDCNYAYGNCCGPYADWGW